MKGEGAGLSNMERRSSIVNQDYKMRLNQLSEFIERLEKVRRAIFVIDESTKGQGIGELKKDSPASSFLEIWMNHTEYFTSLLNRLEKVVGELEQF